MKLVHEKFEIGWAFGIIYDHEDYHLLGVLIGRHMIGVEW